MVRLAKPLCCLLLRLAVSATLLLCLRCTAPPAPVPTAPAGHPSPATAVGFRNEHLLDEHWHKHGREFGAVSREQYLQLAQALRDAPVGGDVLEIVRSDGTISRFDRGSGAFIAFEASGMIRTFFRPNDGERYFRRQAQRGR